MIGQSSGLIIIDIGIENLNFFFIQACRGYNHEDPVHDTTDGGDVVDGFTHDIIIDAGVAPTLPNASDFLFCYSVTEGNYLQISCFCQMYDVLRDTFHLLYVCVYIAYGTIHDSHQS